MSLNGFWFSLKICPKYYCSYYVHLILYHYWLFLQQSFSLIPMTSQNVIIFLLHRVLTDRNTYCAMKLCRVVNVDDYSWNFIVMDTKILGIIVVTDNSTICNINCRIFLGKNKLQIKRNLSTERSQLKSNPLYMSKTIFWKIIINNS